MSANIRMAGIEDMAMIVAMAEQFYGASPWAALADFDPSSTARSATHVINNGFLLVAESEGKPVGMLGVVVGPFLLNFAIKSGTEVMWYVDPDHRDTGAAIKLMRAGRTESKRRGCKWLAMGVLSSSPPQAAELYVRSGYRHLESAYILEL